MMRTEKGALLPSRALLAFAGKEIRVGRLNYPFGRRYGLLIFAKKEH